MKKSELQELVLGIVSQAVKLKDDVCPELKDVPVGYACIFCQSDEEFEQINEVVLRAATILEETKNGSVYQIEPLITEAGPLRILKVRSYDLTRPERGDADFNLDDYDGFKEEYREKDGFKVIPRKGDTEMIELMQDGRDVRVYFSNPPVEEQFDLPKLSL